jgi:hypothetical protein
MSSKVSERLVGTDMKGNGDALCRHKSGRPGVDPRSEHVGFAAEVALEVFFSPVYFGFPCQFSFHRMLHTHLSSGADTICPLENGVPRDLSVTQRIKRKSYTVLKTVKNSVVKASGRIKT